MLSVGTKSFCNDSDCRENRDARVSVSSGRFSPRHVSGAEATPRAGNDDEPQSLGGRCASETRLSMLVRDAYFQSANWGDPFCEDSACADIGHTEACL
jgi:hypothetical protein